MFLSYEWAPHKKQHWTHETKRTTKMFICVCNFVTTFYLIKCVFTVFSTKYKRVFLAMVNKLAKNTLYILPVQMFGEAQLACVGVTREKQMCHDKEKKKESLTQAKFFLRKLMSPLVDESWEWTSVASLSSGSIFFASCLPSSTLITHKRKQLGEFICLLIIRNDKLT